MGKKIAVVTDVPFWRESRGDQARISALIKGISKFTNFDVDVLMLSKKPIWQDAEKDTRPYGVINSSWTDVFQTLLSLARREIFDEIRRDFRRIKELFQIELAACTLHRRNYHAVIVEYLRLHPISDRLLQRREKNLSYPQLILDIHDIQSLRSKSLKVIGINYGSVNLDEEIDLMKKFDKIISIQDEETQLLLGYFEDGRIFTLPHLPEVVARKEGQNGKEGVLRLGFIGSTAAPNIDGISWFISDILPLLQSKFDKDIQVIVAGSVCSKLICKNPSVLLVGPINELDDFYGGVDICINPVRAGSGLKIKSIEALRMLKPLVTTSIGAQGLNRGEEPPFWIADTPELWVEALQKIGMEQSEDITRRIDTFLRSNFDPHTIFLSLQNFLAWDDNFDSL